MDTLEIGTSLDWLGEKAPANAEEAQPAEPVAPKAEEVKTEGEKPAEPAKVEAAEPAADEPLAIPQIVDDLGGEDGARQLIPLVRAIQLADGEPGEVGTALHDALLKVFTPDQFSALTWTQYDKYGQLMAEQFLEDNPEFLKTQGYVKASEVQGQDDDEDLFGLNDEPSEREKQLQAELNTIKQQLGQLQQKDTQSESQKQQQAQANVVSEAEKAMFGSVVDKTVGELEGWAEPDIQKALRYAFASFNQDQKAVEQYRIGVKYQATKQALLQGSQVKASKAFESYLAEAIEMVDAKRTKTDAKKAPIPPTRREFSTTTPGQDAVQPKANGNGKAASPFDPNMLMKAVQERLQARGANQ